MVVRVNLERIFVLFLRRVHSAGEGEAAYGHGGGQEDGDQSPRLERRTQRKALLSISITSCVQEE